MGWCGGSDIAEKAIKAIKPRINDTSVRFAIYVDLIVALQENDWDNEDEVIGLDYAFDLALTQLRQDAADNQ